MTFFYGALQGAVMFWAPCKASPPTKLDNLKLALARSEDSSHSKAVAAHFSMPPVTFIAHLCLKCGACGVADSVQTYLLRISIENFHTGGSTVLCIAEQAVRSIIRAGNVN